MVYYFRQFSVSRNIDENHIIRSITNLKLYKNAIANLRCETVQLPPRRQPDPYYFCLEFRAFHFRYNVITAVHSMRLCGVHRKTVYTLQEIHAVETSPVMGEWSHYWIPGLPVADLAYQTKIKPRKLLILN